MLVNEKMTTNNDNLLDVNSKNFADNGESMVMSNGKNHQYEAEVGRPHGEKNSTTDECKIENAEKSPITDECKIENVEKPIVIDECGIYEMQHVVESVTYNKLTYPMFANYDLRLKTFELWPKSDNFTEKATFSRAGLFYNGVMDETVCFFCGVTLKNWETDDNPWEQHAIWFPNCPYIIMVKGQTYIKNIIDNDKGQAEVI